jgi:hypothetical protein
VQLSVALLPKALASRFPAGRQGRDAPNSNPLLPPPDRPPAMRQLFLGLQSLWDECNAVVPLARMLHLACCCWGTWALLAFVGHYGLLAAVAGSLFERDAAALESAR